MLPRVPWDWTLGQPFSLRTSAQFYSSLFRPKDLTDHGTLFLLFSYLSAGPENLMMEIRVALDAKKIYTCRHPWCP